jgi:hypothetical protein
MKIWIVNIAPGTTDEEIKALVAKYGPGLECVAVERVDGDGSRPGATLEVSGANAALGDLVRRLNGMYWKGRELASSQVIAR